MQAGHGPNLGHGYVKYVIIDHDGAKLPPIVFPALIARAGRSVVGALAQARAAPRTCSGCGRALGVGLPRRWRCALGLYAQCCGAWSAYQGGERHLPLPGGDRRAHGDAQACRDLRRRMAVAEMDRRT